LGTPNWPSCCFFARSSICPHMWKFISLHTTSKACLDVGLGLVLPNGFGAKTTQRQHRNTTETQITMTSHYLARKENCEFIFRV
jgi:hypothetical protein